MRIHSDHLKSSDFYSAALIARVDMDLTTHGSRSRAGAFNVLLTGESRRRPNMGTARYANRGAASGVFAATWDQWGVFLAVLFAADSHRSSEATPIYQPERLMHTPYDTDYFMFAARTGDRFGAPEDDMTAAGYRRVFNTYGWPEDAHGDHSWLRPGRPGVRLCRDCNAEERWGALAAQYVGA